MWEETKIGGEIMAIPHTSELGVRCHVGNSPPSPLTVEGERLEGKLESVDFGGRTFVLGGQQYGESEPDQTIIIERSQEDENGKYIRILYNIKGEASKDGRE